MLSIESQVIPSFDSSGLYVRHIAGLSDLAALGTMYAGSAGPDPASQPASQANLSLSRLQSFSDGKWASKHSRLSSEHRSWQLCFSRLTKNLTFKGMSGTGGEGTVGLPAQQQSYSRVHRAFSLSWQHWIKAEVNTIFEACPPCGAKGFLCLAAYKCAEESKVGCT